VSRNVEYDATAKKKMLDWCGTTTTHETGYKGETLKKERP